MKTRQFIGIGIIIATILLIFLPQINQSTAMRLDDAISGGIFLLIIGLLLWLIPAGKEDKFYSGGGYPSDDDNDEDDYDFEKDRRKTRSEIEDMKEEMREETKRAIRKERERAEKEAKIKKFRDEHNGMDVGIAHTKKW